jgi:hypothetical protein
LFLGEPDILKTTVSHGLDTTVLHWWPFVAECVPLQTHSPHITTGQSAKQSAQVIDLRINRSLGLIDAMKSQ